MKKLNLLLVLFAVTVFSITSCKKGDTGPSGPAGATGANGAAGAAGTPGADGSIIYSGTTAPDASKGVNGDFYINTSNGLLYGPKTATGWGTGFSLKGPAGVAGAAGQDGTNGTNGKNGSQILSGTGAPAANAGATGDYYFDKGSDLLYGPKIASGWGAATNLKGADGANGVAGPAGTANVIYSGWLYATNFRDTTVDNSSLKAGDIAAPKLTTSILNGGTMMIYFTYGGGVLALPYTSNAGGKSNTISFMPRLGHFIITRFTDDNSNSVALSTLLQYRYVIIPGGITAAAANHVNIYDFESVRKYYHLAD